MARQEVYTRPAHRPARALPLIRWPDPADQLTAEEREAIDRAARARVFQGTRITRATKNWLREDTARKQYYVRYIRYYRAWRATGFVVPPNPPPGLDRKERERIERLARRAVKRGYRRQAEDYPVPSWIARSARRKEYYLARLRFELALREGYKND